MLRYMTEQVQWLANVRASAVIKRQQPHPEFAHCRSHCINLAVVFACKTKSFVDLWLT